MRNNVKILRYQALAVAAIGVFIFLIAVAAGCGDDTETTGTVATATVAAECDPSSPSIIPEPGGRPQFVYFYRDT